MQHFDATNTPLRRFLHRVRDDVSHIQFANGGDGFAVRFRLRDGAALQGALAFEPGEESIIVVTKPDEERASYYASTRDDGRVTIRYSDVVEVQFGDLAWSSTAERSH